MKKAFPNRTNTPPNGWRYTVPETGRKIGPFNGEIQLLENIKAYYFASGYVVPEDIAQKVEDQICEAEPEYCGDPTPQTVAPQAFGDLRHTFHAAVQCLSTLISHRAGSGERPSPELQEKRAAVCVECPKNVPLIPCSICSLKTIQNLIIKLVGAKKTSVDSKLQFCSVCHCANAAKVATKHEAIWNHLRKGQLEAMPDTCWIKTENAEKEAKYAS